MFNEICINEEMLPKYTYIYIYMCVCVCVCVHLQNCAILVWFVGFYDISTFVGYLTPNPFLCK